MTGYAIPVQQRPVRPKIVSNAVLGTGLFVATEVMFFMALLSAFLVIKAGAGAWAPPSNVTLPVVATAFNTLILMSSGILLYFAGKRFDSPELFKSLFLWSLLTGGFFVAFQGYEWTQLIKYGMTMNSGIFGATFFLLIGSHGLHALGAILAMLWLYVRALRNDLRVENVYAMQMFWFFVVGVWPILYGLVYF